MMRTKRKWNFRFDYICFCLNRSEASEFFQKKREKEAPVKISKTCFFTDGDFEADNGPMTSALLFKNIQVPFD